MGLMLKGAYLQDDPQPNTAQDGEFKRAKSTIRNWMTSDGSAGPTGEGGFKAESGRYHLFLAWNCPWAHRALLARLFKGLQDDISTSFAAPRRTPDGWVFEESGEFTDSVFGA